MKPTVTRRTLLARSAAILGAGATLPRSARVQAHPSPDEESALATGKPKPLPYAQIEGFLGAEQLRWHHESHYGGALRGFLALDEDPTGSHGPRVAKMNSVLLHELYFDNMGASRGEPGPEFAKAIEQRFGSLERWMDDFAAAAKSCRGWAVLARHPLNGKLYNLATDSHDDGPAWLGVPLLVVDVYEHSYYLDFQNRKAEYVDAFCEHVAWPEVERRLLASRN